MDATTPVQLNADLAQIPQGISTEPGEAFFRYLVKSFATVLNIERAFITRYLGDPPTRVHTPAFWSHDHFHTNEKFDPKNIALEQVISGSGTCHSSDNMQRLFPDEQILGAESCTEFPILGSAGTVIGHLGRYLGCTISIRDLCGPGRC